MLGRDLAQAQLLALRCRSLMVTAQKMRRCTAFSSTLVGRFG